MKRRRNPDIGQWALLAGVGLVAYFVYKLVNKAGTAISTAASNTSSGIADIAETLFPHAISTATLAPGSTILLGTGQEIASSAAQGVGAFTDTDGVQKFQFYYAGQNWRTTTGTPDDTNTYYATTG